VHHCTQLLVEVFTTYLSGLASNLYSLNLSLPCSYRCESLVPACTFFILTRIASRSMVPKPLALSANGGGSQGIQRRLDGLGMEVTTLHKSLEPSVPHLQQGRERSCQGSCMLSLGSVRGPVNAGLQGSSPRLAAPSVLWSFSKRGVSFHLLGSLARPVLVTVPRWLEFGCFQVFSLHAHDSLFLLI
jgi:hypothetical protein